MTKLTKKLNQSMPHDDFMAECNASDLYVEDLKKENKALQNELLKYVHSGIVREILANSERAQEKE